MNVTVFPRFFLQQFNILGSLGTNYTSEGQLRRNSFQPRQLTCTATLFAEKIEVKIQKLIYHWKWSRGDDLEFDKGPQKIEILTT